MVTYNHEDQEKVDGFKGWWDKYGTAIVIFMTVMLATAGAIKAWEYYQKKQAQQAGDLYVLLKQVQAGNDSEKINDTAQLLMQGYSSSGYAPRAALIAAQADAHAGNNKRAIQNLQWILDHAKETEMRDLARLRISGILLDEGKYDEALRFLDDGYSEAFSGLYLDRKGDIQVATQRISEARLSYQEAINALDKSNNYYNIVQMKLDGLGNSE